MPHTNDDIMRCLIARRSQLLGYIWSIVHDEHLAEDVFQNIFVVVSRKAPEAHIEDDDHLFRWIRKVARFEALNAMRKSQRSPLVFSSETLDLLEQEWSVREADEDDRMEALRFCLSRLSTHAERLVRLRYGEQLSCQQIAGRIDRKVPTVYTALSRIHLALRNCISKQQRLNG